MTTQANKNRVASTICREPSPLAVLRSLSLVRSARGSEHLPLSRSRSISAVRATGIVGATILVSSAAIDVVRAWLAAPGVVGDLGQVLGGAVVALFVLGALGSALRAKELGGVAVASSFALLVYGAILVMQGQSIGILFVGLAPLSGVLTHITFRQTPAPELVLSGTIDLGWAIAKCRAKTARTAARAVSRSPLATAA